MTLGEGLLFSVVLVMVGFVLGLVAGAIARQPVDTREPCSDYDGD